MINIHAYFLLKQKTYIMLLFHWALDILGMYLDH